MSTDEGRFWTMAFWFCALSVGGLFCALNGPCSDTGQEKARGTLELSGYEQIKIEGWSPLRCSDSDFSCVGFKATLNGRPVKGSVGCGVFKSCTVRVEP